MRKIIVILAALIILPSCLCAQVKLTSDPNSIEAKTSAEHKADPRLAQKINYEAKRTAVVDVLSDLSKATGVTLYAGYNTKDWQVRDRKMNIFAKDVILADLMSSIARVMKFKWLLSDEGEATTYRIYMDRKTLLDAEAQAYRQEEKIEKELAKKREKMLTDFGSVDKLSPQDIEKLKTEDPFMYIAATSGLAAPIGQFFREFPPAIDALASGQEMTLRGSTISPAAKQALKKSLLALSGLASKLSGGKANMTLPDDMDQVTMQINHDLEEAKSSPLRGMILGELSFRYGDHNDIDIPFLDSGSPIAKLFGRALIQSQEEGKPLNEIMKSMNSEIIASVMTQIQKDDSGEPTIEHSDDPTVKVKIKFKPTKTKLEDVESALADAGEFSVVSDSFDVSNMPINFSDDEIVLKDALEKIAGSFHYNWDKRSSILEFRDRNWFRKRNAQIPQAWIDAWKKTLKDTGTLDIGDLAQIAVLTQEQFNVNIIPDEDLMRCGLPGTIYPNRDWLRAYAALDDYQRAAIFVGGLDLKTLTSDQWKQLGELITRRNSSYLQNLDAQIVLDGKRTSKDGRIIYDFSITTTDDLPPIKRNITTPKYQEPPKEDKTTPVR